MIILLNFKELDVLLVRFLFLIIWVWKYIYTGNREFKGQSKVCHGRLLLYDGFFASEIYVLNVNIVKYFLFEECPPF